MFPLTQKEYHWGPFTIHYTKDTQADEVNYYFEVGWTRRRRD